MMRTMRKVNIKGFSLIELMVVVAIIGILSAVAIPNFNRFQRRARTSEGKSALGGIYSAEKSFFAEWEGYTTDLVAAGYSTDGQLRYNAGFTAGTTYPGTYTMIGMTLQPMLGNVQTLCGNALFGMECALHNALAAWPALPAGSAVANAAVSTNSTFTSTAGGDVGGQVPDQWSINNTKTLVLIQDGTTN